LRLEINDRGPESEFQEREMPFLNAYRATHPILVLTVLLAQGFQSPTELELQDVLNKSMQLPINWNESKMSQTTSTM
jgi:hypothetical protein